MVQYRRFRTKNRYIYFALAAIALLLFLYFGLFNLLMTYLIFPIQRGFSGAAVSFNKVFTERQEEKDLRQQNQELEIRLTELISENARLKVLEEENLALRKDLDFYEKTLPEKEKMMARVIGRVLDNPSVIILDKGLNQGIIPGLAVTAEGGTMIGKIFKVSENRSELRLPTDTSSLIAGTILNEERTTNLVTGKFGISLEIDLIPQTEELNLEDLVVTSGLEEHIPRGLVIGKVIDIHESSDELFKKAIVEPLINYSTLHLVSVILPD